MKIINNKTSAIQELERRDPKGLYKRARNGEIQNFTGIDSPYEEPENPELIVDTEKYSSAECALAIFKYLKMKKFVN